MSEKIYFSSEQKQKTTANSAKSTTHAVSSFTENFMPKDVYKFCSDLVGDKYTYYYSIVFFFPSNLLQI